MTWQLKIKLSNAIFNAVPVISLPVNLLICCLLDPYFCELIKGNPCYVVLLTFHE
jgi:hypothetical protein